MKLYIQYYSTNMLNCGTGLNTVIKETPKTFVCENDVTKRKFTIKKAELDEICCVYDCLRFMTFVNDKNEGNEKSKIAFKKYFEDYGLI